MGYATRFGFFTRLIFFQPDSQGNFYRCENQNKLHLPPIRLYFSFANIDFSPILGKNDGFLGFDHEQNRPDRDQYVIMHWEKIRDDKKWNFQIMTNGEWKSTGHEYDFQSVMHYSSKNFAKDGVGPTMTRRVSSSWLPRPDTKSGLVRTIIRMVYKSSKSEQE